MKRLIIAGAVVALMFGTVSTAFAAGEAEVGDWPSRDVRYVVPYAPGGLSDVTARMIERAVREENLLERPFVITNIAGASAGNAMEEVRAATPDGHLLLHHHTSFISHVALGVRDWGYEEFTPIAMLFEVPQAAFALPGEWDGLEDYFEYVRANPGETTFAGSSLGGGTHLMGEMLLSEAGIRDDLRYVAHGGGGPMTAALLAGEDLMGLTQLPTVLGDHHSGDFEILAVSSAERVDSLPDVPTFAELGYDIPLQTSHRMGVWGPPNMPQELVDEIAAFFRTVVESDTFRQLAAENGLFVRYEDGETLRRAFEQDEEIIMGLVEEFGLN